MTQPYGAETPGVTPSQYQRLLEAKQYVETLRRQTPRIFVTQAIIAVTAAVYLMMIANGVDWMDPSTEDLVVWGANFGVATASGEWHRLLTSVFIHVGLIHIGFNMIVLYQVGRTVERLFGNGYFCILYVLSGLGGSIASMGYNPLTVSAGASGAVFGIFGGLLGVLAAERRSFPPLIADSLRKPALMFVGINILIGFSVPFIDNAAHLGGLATGFLCGLFIRRPSPTLDSAVEERPTAPLRRVAGTVLMAVILTGSAWGAAEHVRSRPDVDFIYFLERLQPIAADFDEAGKEIRAAIWTQIGRPPAEQKDREPAVKRLAAETAKLREQADRLAPRFADAKKLKELFLAAAAARENALAAFSNYLQTGDDGKLAGRDGFESQMIESQQAISRFAELRDDLDRKFGFGPQ